MSREGEKINADRWEDRPITPFPSMTLLHTPLPDMVNHPPHYTAGEIECIDAIKAALGADGFAAYLRGQVMKYIWRCGRKDAPPQEAAKARWYLDRLIKELGGAP